VQVMNNTPVFFLRDPSKFPLFIHTQKRNPQTNLKDADMFWDYLSTNPESIHQVMILFSDRGTPDGYAHMNGYSGHTFKLVDKDGNFNYAQFHFKIDQGVKTLDNEQAGELSGANPDYATQDLFEKIESGNYPSWTVYVQVLSPEQAEKFRWNIFDLTKIWPQGEVPLRKFGKMTLNKNPVNYFAEIEQAAFSPSHTVPGIEPSADPVLQSRLFSYPDTHRHRLGVNYQQIPVNKPRCPVFNFQRDGAMAIDGNYGSNPNYIASDRPVKFQKAPTSESHEQWTAHALTFMHQLTDDDFAQPAALWEKVLARQPGQQDHLVHNIAVHLSNARKDVRERQYAVFDRVSKDMGKKIKEATEAEAAKNHPVESKL
jgi:catalase